MEEKATSPPAPAAAAAEEEGKKKKKKEDEDEELARLMAEMEVGECAAVASRVVSRVMLLAARLTLSCLVICWCPMACSAVWVLTATS